MPFKLTSKAFINNSPIPDTHSKKGGNVSPPLDWSGVPPETRSLVLIVDDPDAPKGIFTHWLVYGMKPDTSELKERQPASPTLPGGARQGVNGFGDSGYGGPQPPSGTHRYFFHLYALDTDSDMPPGLTRQELDGILEGHVIEEATLMGLYTHREGKRAA